MATLGQLGEVITDQLRERVDSLVSAVENDVPDFTEIAGVAGAVGEFAETIVDIYGDLERTLLGGLKGDDGDEGEGEGRAARSGRREPKRAQGESAPEDMTKGELLDQARELHVEGRSSMAKEELAQAIEAAESVSRQELLERARDAHIDGRSSMTKEELREALHEAGA